MKILVAPADTGGCGSYRLIWPARALKAQGHDVHILGQDEVFVRAGFDHDDRVAGIAEMIEADVVVMQRVAQRDRAELIPHIQARGVAVVVDVDDDLTRIPPGNVARDAYEPGLSEHRNYEHLLRACDAADLITVSTPALAGRFAPHGRVVVLPNQIPQRYLTVQVESWTPLRKLRVGWAGSVDTHPGDLTTTQGAVGQIMREQNARATFHVIGTGNGVQRDLDLHWKPTATDWVPLTHYADALAQLDVGIVPLRACSFNRAKSWLKGLEMAAVGVPFVASPTPEYERLAKLGAGVLAGSAADWRREVTHLIVDHGWRTEVAARGREMAATQTIEANASRWLDAWTKGYERHLRDAARAQRLGFTLRPGRWARGQSDVA